MVSSVKWVDEVIQDAPYAINEDFMNKLFTDYRIDYIIHGDDPCLLPDGSDAYAHAKKAGRYKQIKRTEGVSSTDIVGMLPYPWPYILRPLACPYHCLDLPALTVIVFEVHTESVSCYQLTTCTEVNQRILTKIIWTLIYQWRFRRLCISVVVTAEI